MTIAKKTVLVPRHALATRLTHWINAVCLGFLLLSGLQIFNAWPSLYWGQVGADGDHAFLSIAGFPGWATLPAVQDLASGRRWHLLFAWCFVINGAIYLAYSLWSGHLRRDLLPTRGQLAPRHLWHEILDHARLRFPKGEEAKRYNALQKMSYVAVALVLLPAMVLTGLTMSPGINAVVPGLLDLFGGRQSARAIHFITASLVVLFVVVHLAMVLLSGVWNNLRSMITGRYAIEESEQKP
jgi:thiosulfate reductase cytochrome b subunit